MLAALVLAVIAVGLILLGRIWVTESGDRRRVEGLIDLAVRDQAAALRLLREHPELLQARYVHDETPLHYCAVKGLQDGVRFLARAGMPLDAPNAFGDTALVDVVTAGDLEMARLLLRLGADPNVSSRGRGSVLHIAAGRGEPALVAALLDAGARADAVTDRGERVRDAVLSSEPARTEVLKLLDAHDAGR